METSLFVVSLIISFFSLAISLITLFFNFINKRKPQIYLPTRIYVQKDTNWGVIIRMPITFLNKGSRLIVIRNLELDVFNKNQISNFCLIAQTDKMKFPSNVGKEIEERLVSPFDIKKYSSITKFSSFAPLHFKNIIENPDKYCFLFTISYNKDKAKTFFWKLLLDDKMSESFTKEGGIIFMNTPIRKEIVPLNKLEKRAIERADKHIVKK